MGNAIYARWTGWDGTGLDHCALLAAADGFRLEGCVIGGDEPAFAASYRVIADELWRTRSVEVSFVAGARLHLTADGQGRWYDQRQDGRHLPSLDGCIDVDIGITPATNTLPIRRLALREGNSAEILATFIPGPSGGNPPLPVAARQRYTCIEADKRYRYDGLSTGFSASILVDEHALVRDYPDTFRRVEPAGH